MDSQLLYALLNYPEGASGAQLWVQTDIYTHNLYPMLSWLEGHGWVSSEFADGPFPRKRMYKLTDRGIDNALYVITEMHDDLKIHTNW